MKTDFKKSLNCYQARQGEFRILDLPPLQYLMIDGQGDPLMVPEWVTIGMFHDAVAMVAAKNRPASLDRVRIQTLREGACVQTLHIGPYDDETDVLAELHHNFIPNSGLRMTGKHHEIYLNDRRKVEASWLRTILRQPVERVW